MIDRRCRDRAAGRLAHFAQRMLDQLEPPPPLPEGGRVESVPPRLRHL